MTERIEHLENHPFDLTETISGDWFMGCLKCGQQLPKRHIGPRKCCICGQEMFIFTVKPEDLIEPTAWDKLMHVNSGVSS